MTRFLFAVTQGFHYRKQLAAIKHKQVGAITDIDLAALHQQGIRELVFDFDGVLAGHGEAIPHERTADILKQSVSIFGEGHVFILTNKPQANRQHYFKTHFTGIHFIQAPRKKPYPDGLLNVINTTHAKPEQVALIDDRLLTGALAACQAGVCALYINKPLVNYKHRPMAELFFAALRKFERLFFI